MKALLDGLVFAIGEPGPNDNHALKDAAIRERVETIFQSLGLHMQMCPKCASALKRLGAEKFATSCRRYNEILLDMKRVLGAGPDAS